MSERRFSVVSVIGLGYTGLPTAAFIAASGTRVIGVDTDIARVEQISGGELPFTEPGFESLLEQVVRDGHLSAQSETPQADAYVVAVPTPLSADHKIDMQFILDAATNIADQLRGGELIVLESTSPPGTTQRMADFIIAQRPDLTLQEGQPNSIYFAHAPERVLPGNIMVEMARNDRVIGGTVPAAAKQAETLYSTFCNGKIHTTDAATAEMVKLTENAFRDVNIAFANELSMICNEVDVDVWELIKLANHHPRVNILQPGPGVGGHCVAVDPWFVITVAPDKTPLLRAARAVNDSKPEHVAQQAIRATAHVENPVVACLGLTFKANIDDMRNSPAIRIIRTLCDNLPNGKILVADPHVSTLPESLDGYSNLQITTINSALLPADLVLLLVAHDEFKTIPQEILERKMTIDVVHLMAE